MSIRAVHHLNCATMCPVAGVLLGEPRLLARGKLICHCLLLETERDGLVLVDTGLGTRDVEGRTNLPGGFKRLAAPRLDPAEPALAQVRALGFAPQDLRHIVITHLDLNHAGGLSDFPWAKVHLHAREHAAAMARSTFMERQRYLTAHWHHGPAWEVYSEDGDTWRGLPAIERLPQFDGARRRASAAALRQLRASYSDLDLFCAHSPAEWEAMRARNAPWRAGARATA